MKALLSGEGVLSLPKGGTDISFNGESLGSRQIDVFLDTQIILDLIDGFHSLLKLLHEGLDIYGPRIGRVDVFQDLIPGFEGKGVAKIGLHLPEGGHGGAPLGELPVIIFHLIDQKRILQPFDHQPADLNPARRQKNERQEDPDGRNFQAQGFWIPVGDHHDADRGRGSLE